MRLNPVNWFEIYVSDMPRAIKFYETVFATKLEVLPAPMPNLEMYVFPMEMNHAGAAGALVKMQGITPCPGSTLIYFRSDDVATELNRVVTAGGKIHMPKTSIAPYGDIAMVIDTEGNMIGLHNPPMA